MIKKKNLLTGILASALITLSVGTGASAMSPKPTTPAVPPAQSQGSANSIETELQELALTQAPEEAERIWQEGGPGTEGLADEHGNILAAIAPEDRPAATHSLSSPQSAPPRALASPRQSELDPTDTPDLVP